MSGTPPLNDESHVDLADHLGDQPLLEGGKPSDASNIRDIHILIVDDEVEITEELAEVLSEEGFTVSATTSPLTAISMVQENDNISVVITDLSMPEMTGLEMMEKLNLILPAKRDVAVIVATSQADTNWVVKALRLGAFDFLAKPINLDILIHSASRAVETMRLKYLERDSQRQLENRVLERTKEVRELSRDLLAANDGLQAKNTELEAANRIKSEFLSLINHEFRTPLTAIIGFSGLMKLTHEIDGNTIEAEYNNDILVAGNKLLKIINTIQELIDVRSGDLKLAKMNVNVSKLINQVVETHQEKANEAGVEIQIDLDGAPEFIYADSHRLAQTIGNILDNAIRFSADSKTVKISVIASGGRATISVADHGIGMTAEQIKIAEEPFRQVDSSLAKTADGIGLGLTLSRMFIELHDGEFNIHSTDGAGTVVDIIFPMRNDNNDA